MAGARAVGRDHVAHVERVREHLGREPRGLFPVSRQLAHQRADAHAELVGLCALDGGQADHLAHAVELAEPARQTVDLGERGGREDVVGEDADDGDLLAAESRAGRLVVGAVRIVAGQQVLDRAVDADLGGEISQDDGRGADQAEISRGQRSEIPNQRCIV